MRRRDFLKVVAGSVAAWPLAVRAQESAIPLVGFLNSGSSKELAHLAKAFHRGLAETGFIDGNNLATEYRWAEGHYDRLPTLVAELIGRHVRVIFAGGPPAAFAAKAATASTPIVFTSGFDPVKAGLVASFNHPGGNITGVSVFTGLLGAKLLGLLRDLVPGATVVAVLVNPKNDPHAEVIDVQVAGQALGLQIQILNASSDSEIERAFASLIQPRVSALIVGADPFFNGMRDKIVALAARERIPTIYYGREYTSAGGLISYGASLADGYRQAGIYAGRILKGENPADLPVLQPTKYELVINLKTAKALGLTVPLRLQASADEIIE